MSLAALFAFGGRLADTMGHRRMVVLGVIVFAGASGLCGLTPKGSAAEAWIITFRAVQGAGGAIMFPAALGIVDAADLSTLFAPAVPAAMQAAATPLALAAALWFTRSYPARANARYRASCRRATTP